jgi:nucleolar protein 14
MFAPGDDTPLAILQAVLNLLDRFCDLWDGKSAFIEVFEPAIEILSHLSRKECIGLLGPEFKVCITNDLLFFDGVVDYTAETSRRHI